MEFNGPTSLRVALEQSLNLVTVRVAQRVGMDAVAKTAEAFGMTDKMPHVLPAALGAVDTTVLREAGAYASIAAMGRKVTPTLVDSVQDHEGHVVWRPGRPRLRVRQRRHAAPHPGQSARGSPTRRALSSSSP